MWLLLTEARTDSWIIGIPVVVAAALASTQWSRGPGWRWRPSVLLSLVPRFIWYSIVGGIDVAWRSCHPRLPIAPQIIAYRSHLPEGTALVFLINIINLLPGSVVADIRGDTLTLHVLDGRQSITQQLLTLEVIIARLFVESVRPDASGTAVES